MHEIKGAKVKDEDVYFVSDNEKGGTSSLNPNAVPYGFIAREYLAEVSKKLGLSPAKLTKKLDAGETLQF